MNDDDADDNIARVAGGSVVAERERFRAERGDSAFSGLHHSRSREFRNNRSTSNAGIMVMITMVIKTIITMIIMMIRFLSICKMSHGPEGKLRINSTRIFKVFTKNCPSRKATREIWKTLKIQLKLILAPLAATHFLLCYVKFNV